MPKLYNLNKLEREVLYKKYIQSGMDPIQANKRLEMVKNHLQETVDNARAMLKSDKEIEIKFRQEFYKVCQEAEAMC